MKRTISAELDASAQRVFTVLSDLSTYVEWLDMVTRAVPAEPAAGDAGPAWYVTLRAKVGPLARSKRLRMVRAWSSEPNLLKFERAEVDGRSHSPWVLRVDINGDRPCLVEVDLRYRGRLWSAPLDRILAGQADSAVPRLAALVSR